MRRCGACHACCIHLAIANDPTYDSYFGGPKAAGVACASLVDRPGGGKWCGIWSADDRPRLCGTYQCGWLSHDALPESHRPDRAGVIFEKRFLEAHNTSAVVLLETKPDAFDTPVGRDIARMCQEMAQREECPLVSIRHDGDISTATVTFPKEWMAMALNDLAQE